MPLFDFTGGANQSTTLTSANGGLNFTDNSVNFTLSTVNPSGQTALYYSPGAATGVITISDFNNTGTITLAVNDPTNDGMSNPILNLGQVFSGNWQVEFVHATNTALNHTVGFVTAADGGNITAPAGEYSAIKFTNASGFGGAFEVQSLTATIVCYLEGTGIDTPAGSIKVEDLQPGDTVLTADGGTTTVQWVGKQPVETRLTHPARVNPIRIAAGAIADGVPARDLYVSPDHAIEIDGLLVNASALINGKSITMVQKMPLEGFNYYHVETDAHEVILAEGCPAESYVDMPDRSSFVNGAERADVAAIAEMDLPRITARRLLPQALVDRLAERADRLAMRKTRAA